MSENNMSTIGGLVLATYEGLEQNTETGEAVCNGIPTGWFFELPTQLAPTPDNPETGRERVTVTPWAFATPSTAQRVLELLWQHTKMPCEIFQGDAKQFPISVPMRQIGVQDQPRRVAVNAGLVAAAIARTTAEVGDGQGGKRIVQNANPAIAQAIYSLLTEIDGARALD